MDCEFADRMDDSSGTYRSMHEGEIIAYRKKKKLHSLPRQLTGSMSFQEEGAASTANHSTAIDQNSSMSRNNAAVPRLNGELMCQ